jgi:hypothetical protein
MARFDGKVALIGFQIFGDDATISQLLQADSPAGVVTGPSERRTGIARSRLSGIEASLLATLFSTTSGTRRHSCPQSTVGPRSIERPRPKSRWTALPDSAWGTSQIGTWRDHPEGLHPHTLRNGLDGRLFGDGRPHCAISGGQQRSISRSFTPKKNNGAR